MAALLDDIDTENASLKVAGERECIDCKKTLKKNCFAANQWKTKGTNAR